tara:strand:+ start:2542 stop:3795 length:1254 start_codon:yes stop_codon:yes gene_type:complete
MDSKSKQRLTQLVRQGLVPSRKLPILMTAMSNLHMGKQLTPTERDTLSKYMFNMTDIMLKDDTVFNRTKLHTQKTKYQTEESTVELDEKMVDGVEVVDGPEEDMKKMKKKEKEKDMKEDIDPNEEERMRSKAENKARRLSVRSRSKFRMLPKEIRKEKEKAGLDEDVAEINASYKEIFENALELYGIENIRDLPEEKKKEFFAVVDEAAKMAKKDHDGDGKVETSTAEYMGSRDKAIKKAMKKEEVEQVDELKKSTLSSYIQKAADPSKKKSNVNLASKAAHKLATSDDLDAGEKEDMKAYTRSKGIQTAAKKLAKEEVELTFEEMTPAQKADRLRMVARAADRVQSGQAAKDAEKRAKKDMKQTGAQKGMAPTKKDVEEQVAAIRKTINEGTVKEKIEAYKELNQIIEQFKTTGEL